MENETPLEAPASPVPPLVKMPQNMQIAGAIVIAGVFIAGAILLRGSTPPLPAPAVPENNRDVANVQMRAVSPDEHILGSVNAEIIIVEYSDTECPFCKLFHSTLQSVIAKEGSRVAWVYRHYPIPGLHKKAMHEAEATECAWEQGGNDAFWKYTNQVFGRTLSNDRLDVAELPKIAGDIGLDVNAFNTCLASGKYLEKIELDIADGNGAGVRGTPMSVVIGKKEITSRKQSEIISVVGRAELVSFDPQKKNLMTLNGALDATSIEKIIEILVK